MVILRGKSVYQDICIGRLAFYQRKELQQKPRRVKDREAEWARFEQAREAASQQLQSLYENAVKTVGSANAAVFEMQRLLLEDCQYVEALQKMVCSQGFNLEYAIQATGENMSRMLYSAQDAYIRERGQDIQDISKRLLKVLCPQGEEDDFPKEPSIIAADDLMPSETVQLSGKRVLGFAMRKGSVNSHTAILARSMGVPALLDIGNGLLREFDGMPAVLDGCTGTLYVNPDEKTLGEMTEKKRRSDENRNLLLKLKGLENMTQDGRKIKVFANAGSMEEVESAWEHDAGGIGLLRSEVLYLGRDIQPDEETQFAFYRQALQKMQGKEVVIRTMDIGADKNVPYLDLGREENPALGMRAIRICLERPELFKTQLRALYRAGRYGRLNILYPMITSAEEIKRIRQLESQVKDELSREGIAFAEHIPTGIMIETPAAAVVSDELAGLVDFFSVGTNDLTQYTLALDRQNPGLEKFQDPGHKAVLRLIGYAAENAHRAGIPIGICGELAGDFGLTETFLRMGIDELSVPAGMILPLRHRIRELNLGE